MPTIFSHGAIGLIAAKLALGAQADRRVILASAAVSALPDADVLLLGVIPYGHPLGHRGFTHSLAFAAIVGLALALLFARAGWAGERPLWFWAIFFALVTASHGFFDAMTDGGLGIAFLAPFDHARSFLPWQPIPVSPLRASALLTPRGLRVIGYEVGLFWTFTAASALWERRIIWRAVAASVCVIVGVVMWIWALRDDG